MKVQRHNQERALETRRGGPRRLIVAGAVVLLGAGGLAGFIFRKEPTPAVAPPVINTKDFDPAVTRVVEEARSAVLSSPRSSDAWGRLGMALLAHEVRTEARQCFAQAAALAPDEPRWPYFLGLAQVADDPAGAVTNLQTAVTLFSKSAIVEPSAPRLRLAEVLLSLGRVAEAEQHYRNVLEREPNSAPAALGLGKVANARGQTSEAAELLSKATNDPATGKAAHRLLVSVNQRLGRTNEVEQLSAVLAKLPNDAPLPDPLYAEVERMKTGLAETIDRADELITAGHAAEAAQMLERTVQSYPNSDRAHFFLGRARLRLGNIAGAEQMLARALELSPESVETMVQFGVIRLSQRRNMEAQNFFRAAIKAKPNLPEAWYNLGLSIGGQDRGACMDAFREAIRLKPNFIEAYMALAVVLRADRQLQGAAAELHRALPLKPEEPQRKRIEDQLKQLNLR